MAWYSAPSVAFRRHGERIEPTSKSGFGGGSVVFYEIPVRSVNHFTVDIISYTMRCVYSGEVLFPCSFNTDIEDGTEMSVKSKVFFDAVFTNGFRRETTDRLALSLMNTCEPPFIYKALGAFSKDDSNPNCVRGAFLNGETFVVTTRDVKEGEVLRCSPVVIVTPHPDDTRERQWEALSRVRVEDSGLLSIVLEARHKSLSVRPEGEVVQVTNTMDPGLEEKIRRYGISRKMGFLDVREEVVRAKHGKKNNKNSNNDNTKGEGDEELLMMMEEKYADLMARMDF
jgi:hypothetical protein